MRQERLFPGLICAHGHVNDPVQFGIYLRDGITTILSLGGDKELALREQSAKATPGTAPRLYVAGLIQDSAAIPGAVAVKTPEEARKSVDELVKSKPDIVKVRVDDFLGARPKINPEVYRAVIDEAHKNGFRTAAHVVLLDDAKVYFRAGVDYIAHSVRDRRVDASIHSTHEAAPPFLLPNSHSRTGCFHLFGNSCFLR
jgi:imidazolonepropionase-like amidohydrolase